MDIPTLETDRLILRAFCADDIDAYASMVYHPDVSPFISTSGQSMDRLGAWRHMAAGVGQWLLRGHGFWAAEEKSTGKFVGRIGLNYPETWPGREVAYAVAREHWGKGYATEGAAAARDYAFENLGWDEVVSIIHPDNGRSLAVAERLGETFKENWKVEDVDYGVYALTRADWEKLDR